MIHWFFRIILIGLFTISTATAGSLDAPAPPDDSNSAMHTLEHINNILLTGTPTEITRNAFEEPKYGPIGPSDFPDLNEIYNNTPKYDDDAATVDDVRPGKVFWGLGKNDNWGKLIGGSQDNVESRVLKTGQTTTLDRYDEWNSNNLQDDAHWAEEGYGVEASNKDDKRFKAELNNENQQDNGTVTDQKTGLMWVQNPKCWSFSHCHESPMTWEEAFNKIKALNDLPKGCTSSAEIACYTDWRLPNIKELQSLIDYGHISPALPEGYDAAFDKDTINNYYYWSSTTNLNNAFSSAWAVYMATGMVNGQSKSNPCHVWPVRGGK